MMDIILSTFKFVMYVINFIIWLLGLGVVIIIFWVMYDLDLYTQTMNLSGNVETIIDNLVTANGDMIDATKCSIIAKETAEDLVNHIVTKVCTNINMFTI